MEELSATLDWVRSADLSSLLVGLKGSRYQPIVAVGSGGSLSAAYHLARIQRQFGRQLSVALTPYQLRTEPIPDAAHCWIFSAGGSNVDVVAAVAAARRAEVTGLSAVTIRNGSALSKVASLDPAVRLHRLGIPSKQDGFLATNSLLAFCATTTRAYLEMHGRSDEWHGIAKRLRDDLEQPKRDDWRDTTLAAAGRDHVVVLYDSNTSLGAFDLESKLTEAGIAGVQLADYRHFAHGRHHWLAKNGSVSAVLALISDADRSLAHRTLRLLPSAIPTALFDIPGGRESAQLASLLVAFHATEALGFAKGIDPGQPGVPDFGRKIYRLSLGKPRARSRSQVAIDRKDRERPTPRSAECRQASAEVLAGAHRAFEANLESTTLGGIVLDYDGTIVDTPDRFSPPRDELVGEVVRILSGGLPIGIATGRGRSAGAELREVIPERLWPSVTVGYYNGAVIRGLGATEPIESCDGPSEPLALICNLLGREQGALKLTLRQHQLTVEPEGCLPEDKLWQQVQALVSEQRLAAFRVVRSSHSIDILDASATKLSVVEAVAAHAKASSILRVGDRGRWPGNDHELLASPLGLSVDQVSPDLGMCWHIAPETIRGSRATIYYLRSIEVLDGLGRLKLEDG